MYRLLSAPSRFREWVSGSIRRKLTLFVVTLCLVLVSLFWTLSVYMLQPTYNRVISNELVGALDTVVAILEKAEADGVPIVTTYTEIDPVTGAETTTSKVSSEVWELLWAARDNGTLNLGGRCLEIGGSQAQSLLLMDELRPRCLLHQSHETVLSNGSIVYSSEQDGTLVTLIRSEILAGGHYENTLEGGQMVIGKLTANGYTVVVSANLERIPQAVGVLRGLLVPLSMALVVFSMSCAWAFSLWFTGPVNRLSAAAKQVAKGNYDVSVMPVGNDEFATLTREFNTMAREVKRSADMQRDLLANVSHDLRTPLTLIKGYAETVRDLTGENTEKRNEQLSVIVDEADRLSALVNSVMEFSRMSSGIEKPNIVLFNLYQMCDEVSYRYEALCIQKGYTFDFEGDENLMVEADPAQLERALHNFLGNALNHVDDDGYIGLHLVKTRDGKVRVEVTDHGEGIPENDLPYLFDRYYRSRTSSGRQGTGLGLSIAKAIFTAHNFEFGVQSIVGEGSTFWFEIPLAKPKDKAKEKETEPKKETEKSKTGSWIKTKPKEGFRKKK